MACFTSSCRLASLILAIGLSTVACLERVDLDELPFACTTDEVCRGGRVCDPVTGTCVDDLGDVVIDGASPDESAPKDTLPEAEMGAPEEIAEVVPDTDVAAETDAGDGSSEDVPDLPTCVDGEACDDGDPCTRTDTCTSGVCLGTVPTKDTTCDAVDDDCDGRTDEDWVHKPSDCKNQGVCAGYGIPATCLAGLPLCDYSYVVGYSGGDEVLCDGVDENCDGQIDEGVCP
jgi:hypothetical protein